MQSPRGGPGDEDGMEFGDPDSPDVVQRRGTMQTEAFGEQNMPLGFDAAAQKGRAERHKSLKQVGSIQLKDMGGINEESQPSGDDDGDDENQKFLK